MNPAKSPDIAARKQPQQKRSERLVADILQAATRVLTHEGAQCFTTARVAEVAGVSVGSLYQYFPNKEAILFRLQTDEWQQTGELLEGILVDSTIEPFERLRLVTRAFFRSECEEAAFRVALSDAAPLYRDAVETIEQRASTARLVMRFMAEVLPDASLTEREMAADVVRTTLAAVGKQVSEEGRSQTEVDNLAESVAEMLCGYLQRLRE
ncbi:TetR family transcriptional regulator [Marinobacterium sp. CAU 1594]|nr:TetR family transcriptional regulator [Marinobacterium arenosum]